MKFARIVVLICATSFSDLLAQEEKIPTLFIIGDSTASNGADRGWGSHLGKFFDATKIKIANRARAGRSSRTFQSEGHWEKVLGEMKAGDFVMVQFGHNDGGPVVERPGRGSLKGIGEETQEIVSGGKKEVVHTYGWYLRKYASDARAKGATPIFLSLTVRNEWPGGKVERGSGRFGEWTAAVAKSLDTPFVDLTQIIADRYEAMGREKVKEFFPEDHTHTTAAGAELNASLVVAGLKGTKDCPLVEKLSAKGKEIEAATPSVPK
jgi:rhamnogalacturonan acetylesterase